MCKTNSLDALDPIRTDAVQIWRLLRMAAAVLAPARVTKTAPGRLRFSRHRSNDTPVVGCLSIAVDLAQLKHPIVVVVVVVVPARSLLHL